MNPFRFLWGMTRTVGVLVQRTAHKAAAPARLDMTDPVRETVAALHPPRLDLVVAEVFELSPDARTFRLVPGPEWKRGLPPFRAGQYISVREKVDGARISRPYSISSAPHEARPKGRTTGYYEITVKREKDGFFTPFVWEKWRVGSAVLATGPHGEFYHEPIRDKDDIVAVAGGAGVTPFLSMARKIAHEKDDVRLTLLYGVRKMTDALFVEELSRLANEAPDHIRVCYVVSEPDGTQTCRTGFIDAPLIKDEVGDINGKTFFVCGPAALYEFFAGEAKKLNIPPRRVRWEASGGMKDVGAHLRFPRGAVGKTFELTVHTGRASTTIPARAEESILVALERAGIATDTQCRSGTCGACRCLLISGEVFIDRDTDARRKADVEFGFIHSCATYPVGDCVVKLPSAKAPAR